MVDQAQTEFALYTPLCPVVELMRCRAGGITYKDMCRQAASIPPVDDAVHALVLSKAAWSAHWRRHLGTLPDKVHGS